MGVFVKFFLLRTHVIIATYGYAKIAKELIHAGLSVDPEGEESFSPLHLGVLNNQKDFVKVLVENGADVNTFTNSKENKQSVLELAMIFTNEKMVNYLLSAGARVDILNEKRQTALHSLAFSNLSLLELIVTRVCLANVSDFQISNNNQNNNEIKSVKSLQHLCWNEILTQIKICSPEYKYLKNIYIGKEDILQDIYGKNLLLNKEFIKNLNDRELLINCLCAIHFARLKYLLNLKDVNGQNAIDAIKAELHQFTLAAVIEKFVEAKCFDDLDDNIKNDIYKTYSKQVNADWQLGPALIPTNDLIQQALQSK